MAEPLTQLGRYRIVAELGRGAMGVVYKAEDPMLNRTLAVKTILMSADAEERAEYEARFYQEAKAAGGLNHPNLITIHDIGREGDIAYMAMELLEGVDLRQTIRAGQLTLDRALDIAAQVADGLAFAHERGVVHRDVKPANIMIVAEGRAKIMDFGIARMRMSDVKTQAGSVLGSPRYMSPEQVTGQRADHRSDIFSLGVIVYEMAAGRLPFGGADITQLMHQIATAVPPPPSASNPAAPPMLDLIVARALEKTPERRYQAASELAADLRACLEKLGEAPAGAQETVKVDIPLGETVKTAPSPAAAEAGTHLALSRRFDSTEGVRQLVKLAMQPATGGADAHSAMQPPAAARTVRRLWQDTGWRFFSAAVVFATLAAIVIVVRAAEPANADIARFVPENMRLVQRLDADVTGDGAADTILVSADDKNFEATVTVLMRRQGRSLTDKRQADEFEGVDALKLELTPLGPPTVKVAKGILIVEHLAGGASVRTAATYRYRFDAEEGRMRLIGLDARRTSSTLTVQLSWNALTGAHIIRKGNGPESKTIYKPGTVWMDLTRSADEMIDQALEEKPKRGK